jgi:hypothetical protein
MSTNSISRNNIRLTQTKSLKSQIEVSTSTPKQKQTLNYSKKFTLLNDKSNYYKYHNIPASKTATKSFESIASFAVNSNNGLVRNYNEDRVSIVINVKNPNPEINKKWPSVSYFAIFDGHSGNTCAEFLKENLHNYVNLNLF